MTQTDLSSNLPKVMDKILDSPNNERKLINEPDISDSQKRDKYELVGKIADCINQNMASSNVHDSRQLDKSFRNDKGSLNRLLQFSNDREVERFYARYTSNMESPLGKVVVVGF